MISPAEKDPLKRLWKLRPVLVAVIMIIAAPIGIWAVEVVRSIAHPDQKPPFGLEVFRWTSVYIGDLFIAGLIGILAVYYQKARVKSSFLTERRFFHLCWLVGVLATVGFLLYEELVSHTYPAEVRFNLNRAYHAVYFTIVVSILTAGFRVFLFRQRLWLVLLILVFTAGYVVSTRIDWNPIWSLIVDHYGRARTSLP